MPAKSDKVIKSDEPVKRKDRATAVYKLVRGLLVNYVLPYGRFVVVPGMLAWSIFCTEPAPSLWNLLNPFTR